MLIRVYIENFLSFNEGIEFSMIKGNGKSLPHHVIKTKRNDIDLLKTAILYGANASGKSNFIKAVQFAKELIIKGREKNQSIPINCFKLDDACINKPSKFEFEFRVHEKNYAYGFLLSSEKIIEEWLYEFDKEKDKKIFTRKTSGNEIEIEFENINFENKKAEDRLNFIALDTLPNQLFLTELNHRNIENIKNINSLIDSYEWFDDYLFTIFPHSKFQVLEFLLKKSKNFSLNFSEMLHSFDTGIDKVIIQEVNFEKVIADVPEEIMKDMMDNLEKGEDSIISSEEKRYLVSKNQNNDLIFSKLMTHHQSQKKNDKILFESNEESDGTRRMFDLIPIFLGFKDNQKQGRVGLIDELDRSLHPILVRQLLKLFTDLNRDSNNQLIATTHESNLLDLKLLRNDEIWFVQKNEIGETQMYSLAEFKPRNDKEIRKGYLNGRYGAIPFLANIEELNW